VVDTELGSYLCKFAVTREAQGESLGRDLWQAMTAEHPRLFWPAREDNPIRSWYEKQCDGRTRAGEWIVFWKGLPPERSADAVSYAKLLSTAAQRRSTHGVENVARELVDLGEHRER